jgi:hypothetical protein
MKLMSNVKMFFENTKTKEVEVITLHNIACTVGKNSLANRLIGATKGEITYFAVGTGTDAPAAGDTTLGTEIYRKQISVRSVSGAIATFRIFFNTSEANDTLKEIGLFGDDATVTADTGTLFARAAVDKTKTSSETLTIDWDVEIK